jgi:hypothetical protein
MTLEDINDGKMTYMAIRQQSPTPRPITFFSENSKNRTQELRGRGCAKYSLLKKLS